MTVPNRFKLGTTSLTKDIETPPRWDAASYLRNSTGAGNPANKGGPAFSMIATLEYSSKPGAPEQAVAEHIKQAFTNPKATKPLNALKNVPGDRIAEPLHRLFLDQKRLNRNRDVVWQAEAEPQLNAVDRGRRPGNV
ncbi:hypothetical protein [Streptomyces sp. NPDC085540]|uniref:hypothetical protein n=1 Tax=Streptomyces sp. NPDC085540 TaxID=3365730 RepID=UPI0037D5305B